ncbi:MAG: hypothetical protein ABIP48_06105 [Planctomycetota bacterium]
MGNKTLSPNEQVAYLRSLAKHWDLDSLLDGTEREARATLEKSTEPKARDDADIVLYWIQSLRQRLDKNDRQVITLALKLGALAERMGFRVLEPYAKRSFRAFQKLRAAKREHEHPPEKIAEALRLYDKLMEQHPRRKKGSIQKEVREQTGIPQRPLRHHLAKRSC